MIQIGELLTRSHSSDKGGANLGVLFRRRAFSKTGNAYIQYDIVRGEGQEGRWKTWARQYHELFREEIAKWGGY